MTIAEHKLEAPVVKIGTLTEFGRMMMTETVMTFETPDGRKGEVLRNAFGGAQFEIHIEGEKQHLRLNLKDMINEAAGLLYEELSK